MHRSVVLCSVSLRCAASPAGVCQLGLCTCIGRAAPGLWLCRSTLANTDGYSSSRQSSVRTRKQVCYVHTSPPITAFAPSTRYGAQISASTVTKPYGHAHYSGIHAPMRARALHKDQANVITTHVT